MNTKIVHDNTNSQWDFYGYYIVYLNGKYVEHIHIESECEKKNIDSDDLLEELCKKYGVNENDVEYISDSNEWR